MLVLATLACLAASAVAQAQESSTTTTLAESPGTDARADVDAEPEVVPDAESIRVAIKPAPPFVFDEERPRGFSIDLWNEVAARAGFETTYVWVEDVGAQLDAVESGGADAAIAAISITAEREEVVDFSSPVFDSGLQVMTRDDSEVTPASIVAAVFSGPVLWLVAVMLVASLFMGVVVWLVERSGNPDFHRDARHGVFDGLWWAMVTMMTVGYGDRVPRRRIGRVLTIFWMIVGVIFVANFTAVITTNLTLGQIQGDVRGLGDLESGKVAVVAGTTSEEFLREAGIAGAAEPTADDAFRALEADQVDAVVYDAPILRYYAQTDGKGRVVVVGPVFEPEYYGVALGQGSARTERIDRALLAVREDGTYQQLYERWFGPDS
ncbi:MAG: transporter substrate-binding domain-containing protein [Acidimicrobiales bacterium]|nr:transporter substrate-binding domain-containing protein [Acidimicrobiales bacterium]